MLIFVKEWVTWYADQALEEGAEEVGRSLWGVGGDHEGGRAETGNTAAIADGDAGGAGGGDATGSAPQTSSQAPAPNQQVIKMSTGNGQDVNLVINGSSGQKNNRMSDKFKVPGFPYNGQMEHWITQLGRNLIADGGRADYLEFDWIFMTVTLDFEALSPVFLKDQKQPFEDVDRWKWLT